MKGLEYREITLQAQPSSLRCVVEMKDQRQTPPLACLCFTASPATKKKIKKNSSFITGRIKHGLRKNKCLNSQHHLHKKQQVGDVGGLLQCGLNAPLDGNAGCKGKKKEN